MPIVPVAKGRPRLGRYGTFTPAKTKNFQDLVILHSKKYAPVNLLKSPLHLSVEFHVPAPKKRKHPIWPITRPDCDNYLKGIMDSLNKIIWTDDSIICWIETKKIYADKSPKIVIKIEEL